MRIMKTALWVGLLFSLLVLAIGASWLSDGHWMTATIARSAPLPIIPPGRENVVMAFLGPVMKNGFSDLGISNISLSGSEIRLQLALKKRKDAANEATTVPCSLPDWASAPGTLVVFPAEVPPPQCTTASASNCGLTRNADLAFAWAACATDIDNVDLRAQSAQEWINGLSSRNHEGIWEMPREVFEKPKANENEAGLLTPIVLAMGLDKVFVARMLLCLTMGVTALAALILRWKMGPSRAMPQNSITLPRDGWKRRGIALAALLLIGTFLRIQAAATLPRDTDEGFQGEYVQKILSDDHDSWLHPPLYRAIHKSFFDTTGFSSTDATWKLRIPSVVFSILALCLVAAAIFARNLPYYAEIPFALAALSPVAINDSVLARPYGLAMFGATLCLVAISSRDPNDDETDDWFLWFVAMIGLGLTIWTDLVTSLFAGTFLLARWLHPRSFSRQSRISGRMATAASVAVWVVPFALGLPGAVRASQTIGWPFHAVTSSPSVLDRISTIAWELIGILGFVNRPSILSSLLVMTMFVSFVVLAIKWARTSAGIGLGLMLLALGLVSSYLGMRTRNIVFFPIALAFVASLVVARAPIDAIKDRWRWR